MFPVHWISHIYTNKPTLKPKSCPEHSMTRDAFQMIVSTGHRKRFISGTKQWAKQSQNVKHVVNGESSNKNLVLVARKVYGVFSQYTCKQSGSITCFAKENICSGESCPVFLNCPSESLHNIRVTGITVSTLSQALPTLVYDGACRLNTQALTKEEDEEEEEKQNLEYEIADENCSIYSAVPHVCIIKIVALYPRDAHLSSDSDSHRQKQEQQQQRRRRRRRQQQQQQPWKKRKEEPVQIAPAWATQEILVPNSWGVCLYIGKQPSQLLPHLLKG